MLKPPQASHWLCLSLLSLLPFLSLASFLCSSLPFSPPLWAEPVFPERWHSLGQLPGREAEAWAAPGSPEWMGKTTSAESVRKPHRKASGGPCLSMNGVAGPFLCDSCREPGLGWGRLARGGPAPSEVVPRLGSRQHSPPGKLTAARDVPARPPERSPAEAPAYLNEAVWWEQTGR